MADPRWKGFTKSDWHKRTPAQSIAAMASQVNHPVRLGWGPTRELENDRYWYVLPGTLARIRATGAGEGDGWILDQNGKRQTITGDEIQKVTSDLRKEPGNAR